MRPITAADLMNPHVLTVREDLTVQELASFLLRHQITGAPVEDAAGRLVGVVSVSDIAEGFGDLEPGAREAAEMEPEELDEEQELTVRDIMTPAVVSVAEDATVSEVASKMLDGHVHRLLVTREGQPLGIITTSDLLGLLIDER